MKIAKIEWCDQHSVSVNIYENDKFIAGVNHMSLSEARKFAFLNYENAVDLTER